MASLQRISELIAARQLADAAAALQKTVKKHKTPQNWQSVMQLAANLGDQETALAAAELWAAQAPGDLMRQVALIEALAGAAKHKKAAKLARKLQDKPAAAADGYYLEGVFQAQMGKRSVALPLFRKAISLHKAHTPAWEQIALLNGYEDFDEDLSAMSDLAGKLTAPKDIIPLLYAMGRAFDQADDTDRAFQCFSNGAALRQRLSPFSLEPLLAYLERLRKTFTPERISELQGNSNGDEILFILTAPRSGSTLTEQILSMAPNVAPAGENTLLRLATLPLGSMEPPDMARAAAFKKGDWRKMAQTYLAAIRRRFGAAKYYTDKSATNYYYAGLIRVLFPDTPMIWCRRDLKDIAWSCFRSRISANEWTQNLDDCARFVEAHEELCAYWAQICGDKLIELPYERLVSEPDATTSALFEKVGIERPAAWSEFYKQEGAVATASLAQVRAPLNNKAVGSWRRYEKHLAPYYDKHLN